MKLLRPAYFTPVVHISIWAVLLGIPTIAFWKNSWLGLTQFFFFIASLYHIGLFYLNAWFLYPRLLTKKWWWLYIIVIVAIIALSYKTKIYLLEIDPDFILTEYNNHVTNQNTVFISTDYFRGQLYSFMIVHQLLLFTHLILVSRTIAYVDPFK